jgi:oligoendopeptidase F
MQRWLADRETLNGLWGEFLAVRRKLAANAGYPDYLTYRWRQLMRFDYSPRDCAAFWAAIEDVVVPLARRLRERRRRQLGVETLRPWDLDVDPQGKPPLRPFQNAGDLESGAAAIFRRVDPQLGAYFQEMRDGGLLDLDNRKNKAPGGYCTTFNALRRPFIFMNAVGVHDDVQTLLHEGGHAFHVFESAHLPFLQQREPGAEFAEVASMAMELVGAPYLGACDGGFYDEAEMARARAEHLEWMILFWPYMAVVDAFQHWVYEHAAEAADPAACDAQWQALWRRFQVGVDWSGLEQEEMTGWHRKLHIFTYPLYYVEYGLAQLGAVQVWANATADMQGAVAAYRRALALGNTAPLPALFEAAGARFAFDAPTLRAAVDVLGRTIEGL